MAQTKAARVAAAVVAVLGSAALFLIMVRQGHLALGAAWGVLLAIVIAGGATVFVVADADGPSQSWGEAFGQSSVPSYARLLPAVAFAVIVFAVGAAWGGYAHLPVTIVASLLCLLPASLHRPGVLVFVVVSLLYLPLLGTFGLWDPWESHYAEVAREILSRDDWISLWWAQDNWFWSKPVLLFWSEAIVMSSLGFDFRPDANPEYIEWALRLPVYAMSLAAIMAIYATMRRLFSTRCAVLAALVTATMPHYFLLAHQAITDMPLVASTTIAVCFLLLAIYAEGDEKVGTIRIGRRQVSLQHIVVGMIVAVALPQALYLLSLNLSWAGGLGFKIQGDHFLYGSFGNEGIAGNEPHKTVWPAVPGLLGQPFLQGILWLVGLAWLCWVLRRERRRQRLYMVAFYFFCALGVLAKGLPGLALPGLVALIYLISSGRWSLLSEGRFAVAPGIVVVAIVSMPWYLAMYVRHGVAFTNRLLIHDHINRLAAGVHGDKGSVQYFVEQLGYAAFPWTALIPAALVRWFWTMRDDTAGQPQTRRDAIMLLGLWFFASFALFSAMATKFHHYIFPAVVPLGMLIGLLLDELWGRTNKREATTLLLSGLCVIASVAGIAALWGDLRGIVPEMSMDVPDWILHHRPSQGFTYGAIALSLLAGFAALRLTSQQEALAVGSRARNRSASFAGLIAIGVAICAFVGRDLSWVTMARPQGNERLAHLFVYNYTRPWPEQFDYRPILTGFAIVTGVVFALALFERLRPLMARFALCLALCFCAWSIDVYMMDLSDHWALQKIARRYYQQRSGPDEPFVAWQMNWKGENFYTGNRVHALVSGKKETLSDWLKEHEGNKAFFVLEHNRLAKFKRIVGASRRVRELSTKRECNKYLLVEVEI